MSLSDLASLASFVSGLAVLGSLVYLAIQTRQNAKHTSALIRQSRTTQVTQRLQTFISDPLLMDLQIRGNAADQTLSDIDVARFVYNSLATVTNFQDQFYQHKEGLIDDARHEGLDVAIQFAARNPGFRAAWTVNRVRFDQEFRVFVDQFMIAGRKNEAAPPGLAHVWRTAAAQEAIATSRISPP